MDILSPSKYWASTDLRTAKERAIQKDKAQNIKNDYGALVVIQTFYLQNPNF
jgi:hypothetical protein